MIKVEHLTKYYGDHLAVDDLSFEISEGHVYGFLGPNGAGKSTTMNIITGCLSATSGTVLVDGHDIFEEPNQAKRCIGYLPEHPPLYSNEAVEDYLNFVGDAKGLRRQERREQIEAVMEKTGIVGVRHRRIGNLSKGYQQRVGIAQAILGNPRVIILDEPTVGLDPIQIIEIRDLIKSLGKSHTVIFSSHILSEVQAICDEIVMIAHGKLVAMGEPETLQKQLTTEGEILVTTDADADSARCVLEQMTPVPKLELEKSADGMTLVHVKVDGELGEAVKTIARSFAEHGLPVYGLTQKKGSLEDVFLELTEQKDQLEPAEHPTMSDAAGEAGTAEQSAPAEESEETKQEGENA